ncbi:MAG: carbamoyl-phosphate synthase large subunit [Kiritimatiellae bacterium]|nr:carbamoyl-phosphate synthase large subunit [Kiritimatiellia bacterium]
MKRIDIKKILLVGAGPIVIGQGCEFDYSGVQACKVLKREGYEVVLVNSNPATVMTDPEVAPHTYIEPVTVQTLHEIIRRERPDAILPTLGGQTALNTAMQAHREGILQRYGVEMIGASAEAIAKAEDRQLFKAAMEELHLDMPRNFSAHTLEEAREAAEKLGTWPLVIRPGFTLGGTGGGIAHGEEEFERIVRRGLEASLNSEVLVEESLLGWKEFEMEVMRDAKGNGVIVCSIENLDPMGIHTGDSITVAPIQTLSDREYQAMRDDSLSVLAAIGLSTGGANVQWAVDPRTGRRIIIEMNPRVSRSSALASKATGFPIAKIAALLAVGYTLDELRNDITRKTPACFEPALDYIVVKAPRFAFEKFPAADPHLGTQMKSVGEAMAIGRDFKQALQKALRSLETGHCGFGADAKSAALAALPDAELRERISHPGAERIFELHEAMRRAWSEDDLYALTGIDRYFLRHLAELAAYEDEIKTHGLASLPQAKEFGFSDAQVAFLLGMDEKDVRAKRLAMDLHPAFGAVDTCAGEFEAVTPYYYSGYGASAEKCGASNANAKTVMVLGGGPNRIGQGIEFDWCCCHAAFALREKGWRVVMVNSNPETVSTDYDTSDALYFEPLTLEDVMEIYERERCTGVIVQFGGQTPLNLAQRLKAAGANILGTSPDDIDRAEDRDFFKRLVADVGMLQPPSGIAHTLAEAKDIARTIGYPVLVRPSFVLGGRAMAIVYKEEHLEKYAAEAIAAAGGRSILIDKFLEHAIELDVDCISDGKDTVVGAILEHVEPAGCHSGDSASVTPPQSLSAGTIAEVRRVAKEFARRLHVCGLMNLQLAMKDSRLWMIEVNPRASRTVPFVSKAIGVPLAGFAARCMAGEALAGIGFTEEVRLPYTCVKEAVFPFAKFPGVDITLTPEMKSTGEVMAIDADPRIAYYKSQTAAGNPLPQSGDVFLSVRDEDKAEAVPLAAKLVAMGYGIYATRGTSTALWNAGIKPRAVYRISRGRPNVLDLMAAGEVAWIVNTSEPGAEAMEDDIRMRSGAVVHGVPITTTLAGFVAALGGLEDEKAFGEFNVCSLQEYHKKLHLGHAAFT